LANFRILARKETKKKRGTLWKSICIRNGFLWKKS
jgi:hypothetical protein